MGKGSPRQAGRHRDRWSPNPRMLDRRVLPRTRKACLKELPQRMETPWKIVKNVAAPRMPPGSSAGRAARSRPGAGPRLSDGRPGPPPGGTGGQTGPPSAAWNRPRPGAEPGSTPAPPGSLRWSRRGADDPSSPAVPGSSSASAARAPDRWLIAHGRDRPAWWPRRQAGRWQRGRQRLGTFIQLDRTEPAIAA